MNKPKQFSVFEEDSDDDELAFLEGAQCARAKPPSVRAKHPPNETHASDSDSDEEREPPKPAKKNKPTKPVLTYDDDDDDDELSGSDRDFVAEDGEEEEEEEEDCEYIGSDEDEEEDEIEEGEIAEEEEEEEEEEPAPVKKKSVTVGNQPSILEIVRKTGAVKDKPGKTKHTAAAAGLPKTLRVASPVEVLETDWRLLSDSETVEMVLVNMRKWSSAVDAPSSLHERALRLYKSLLVHEWEVARRDAKIGASLPKYRSAFEGLLLSLLYASSVERASQCSGAVLTSPKAAVTSGCAVSVELSPECVWAGVRRYANNPTGTTSCEDFVQSLEAEGALPLDLFVPWPMARHRGAPVGDVLPLKASYVVSPAQVPVLGRWAKATAVLNAFLAKDGGVWGDFEKLLRAALGGEGAAPVR